MDEKQLYQYLIKKFISTLSSIKDELYYNDSFYKVKEILDKNKEGTIPKMDEIEGALKEANSREDSIKKCLKIAKLAITGFPKEKVKYYE